MEEKEQFKYLYHLYIGNLCTEEELKRFFELLRQQKEDSEVLSLLASTWDKVELQGEHGLNPRFLNDHFDTTSIHTLKPERKRGFILWKAAAAIFLIVGIGYLYRAEVSNWINPVHEQQLLSAAGERKQLLLPDGTKVWLGPGSKFNYPDRFFGVKRTVKLEGEAFFEVKHDSRHPFVIQSGSVSTTVLGTSFNVKAYKLKHDVEVTLVTGKVAVALKNNDRVIQNTIVANQQILVDRKGFRMTKRDFPAAASFLSKRLGLFDYNGETLGVVISDLQIQYGIEIKLEGNLEERAFYGHLKMTDPVDRTLNKLCLVMDAMWQKKGGMYVISK
ncbi:FecR family protein [Pedobacter nutrimenti]|uniref:FecR family protein n=1 Tax=Pedobacter nutrimenti TaxID=1241337 RepID=UPI00292F684A|nr:FecR domain-containing protein [Pedobacter nutrimenti]